MTDPNEAWKSQELVDKYLSGIRAAIPYAADQIDMMLRVIAASVDRVERVADLGCGGGALAAALLERYPGAQAALIDFSEPMIAGARETLAPQRDSCDFIVADLADPAWSDGLDVPFDVVVSGYAIHHLTDKRKRALYAEIHDLLAPGGMFVNVEHVMSATPWLATQSDELIIDSIFAWHMAQGERKSREEVADEFVHRDDKHGNILAMVEDQCAWLRDIGFNDVDCYFKAFELAVFGGRKDQQ